MLEIVDNDAEVLESLKENYVWICSSEMSFCFFLQGLKPSVSKFWLESDGLSKERETNLENQLLEGLGLN
jgi:hypothetical protein